MLKTLLRKVFEKGDNREISTNIIVTFLIKGMAMMISVLIVPAYTKYFGNNSVYGAWLTVAAVFHWINSFDFGIGNGLRNYLVKSLAEKDDNASRRYISSAYVSVGVISLIFLIIGLMLIYSASWNDLLKIPADIISLKTFRTYIGTMYTGVIIHFFFLLITSICYALQKTFLPGLITLITQSMILAFLYVPTVADIETKITNLSVVYLFSYNIPILAVTLILFFGRLKNAKPSIRFFDRTAAKQVVGLGGVFFAIQLALIAMNSSNEIYINTFFSPSDVVQYNYYHRLFYSLSVLMTLFLQPIWSAITKAYYEKRFKWISKIYWTAYGFGALLCLGSFVLALLYQPIADIWLGKGALIVEALPVTLFAIHTSLSIIVSVTNSFSNGFGKIKCQMVCTIVGAVLKFLLIFVAVIWIKNPSWYVVMLSNVIALLPLSVIHPVYIRKYIKKESKKALEEK